MYFSTLAIDGGEPVRREPIPARRLIGEEEKQAVIEVFDEAMATGEDIGYNGRHEAAYEKAFCDFMGGGFADGVNSGTNALFTALGALELDALSEVIVPPISDAGGVMPVLFVGCVPVMADCHPYSYNTCAEEIEPMMTERTRAVVVAHIAGEPADMDPIMALAEKHNLFVIEDCAQAHGASYRGRLAGTMGHMAVFSTMFGKHHCTGGQGGVVFTRDEALYWRSRRFADRGKPFNLPGPSNVANVDNPVAGLNCNLNDLAAAIGRVQLKKLPHILENRRRIAEAVRGGIRDCLAVSFGWQVPQTESAYWFMRFKLDLAAIRVGKQRFSDALRAEGLAAFPHYRHIPCEMPWFKNKAIFGKSGFPWSCSDYKGPGEPRFKFNNAVQVTDTHFNIGLNEKFGQRDIDDIITAIKKVENAYLK